MFSDLKLLTNWLQNHSFCQMTADQFGSTFIDWSINYLCDIKQHTVIRSHGYWEQPIPMSPLVNATGSAHVHEKNQSNNIGEMYCNLHLLYKGRTNNFHTYCMFLNEKNWFASFQSNPIDFQMFEQYQDSYINGMIQLFSDCPSIPHILVYPDFNSDSWSLVRRLKTLGKIKNFNDFTKENWSIGLPNGLSKGPVIDFAAPIENIREQLVLELLPQHISHTYLVKKQLQLKDSLPGSLAVSLTAVFTDLETVLKDIQIKYPALRFDNNQWSSWRKVYHEWRNLNAPDIIWFSNLDHIVHKIICQTSCEMHNLTDMQELTIEMELLLKGYSIKNFNLAKFPNDLSQLQLEPSQHAVYVNNLCNSIHKISQITVDNPRL